MNRPLALIVDDEPDLQELLIMTLKRMDIRSMAANSLAEAKLLLSQHHFNFCLTDMRLPDGDGLEVLRQVQAHSNNTPVAVISAYGSIELAIQALKNGAFDFLAKPLDLQILRQLIQSALKLSPFESQNSGVKEEQLMGHSLVMQELRLTIQKLSKSQAPIHIAGPSGSGKERVARLIHSTGPRAKMPFIAVNCGAIPRDLMESEFFGHKKGSFTGAVHDKIGLFQAAHQGTLFLDEVAELPIDMQVKLLRIIQEKAFRPIGETKESIVDVRILSATHKDLKVLVSEKLFREDLFYRIDVIEINVPSLKDRQEDISLLAHHILQNLASTSGLKCPTLQPESVQALNQYSFPGNVRELENILERALILCENNTITPIDLRLTQSKQPSTHLGEQPEFQWHSDNLEIYLETVEKNILSEALQKCQWSKPQTADLLKISLRTLRYRLKKLQLE